MKRLEIVLLTSLVTIVLTYPDFHICHGGITVTSCTFYIAIPTSEPPSSLKIAQKFLKDAAIVCSVVVSGETSESII